MVVDVRVVIAGGTGSLGRRLADDLRERAHDVVILTRRLRTDLDHRQIVWDGTSQGPWGAELDDAIVVNLAGELVDRRPTAANIELLRRSRVEPTRALVEASRAATNAPRLWLQMSTLAIYGDTGPSVVDEQHPVADGPPQMAGVARPWEQAAADARTQRMVIMRTGVVLDRDTPAFDRLATITRFFLGGRIDDGKQWVSWIHADDFSRAIQRFCEDRRFDGVVHVTSPNPIQNDQMMAALRGALHRPWSPPTPRSLVRVGALFIRTDPALALTGRRCIPQRLAQEGFEFEHPDFPDAIKDLLTPPSGARPSA